jgi:Uma2 family endonuclease
MEAQERTGLTSADFMELADEHRITELIGGALIVPPPLSIHYQEVVTEIGSRLREHAKRHGGRAFYLPVAVKLSETDVVEPDVFYVGPQRVERLSDEGVNGAPDFVVEVLSPWTRQLELHRKRRLYEQHAVPEYWEVDPEAERVDVYVLERGRYGLPTLHGPGEVLRSRVVHGFEIPVDDILGEMPRT